MKHLAAAAVIALTTTALGSGCEARLNPEKVRQFLDDPTGTVSPDSMSRATRDLFVADRATGVEALASLLKTNAGGGASAALPGASFVDPPGGAAFCASAFVVGVAAFDGCLLGQECHDELQLDSCALHAGGLDPSAAGKIRFKLDNTVDSEKERSALGLFFEGWESSLDDELLHAINGQIQLETTRATDNTAIEVVFSSDVDVAEKRKARELFDDGIERSVSAVAGVRFKAEEDVTSASGSLEVLAFVDEDQGAREQSVAIRLAAESHIVDADSATASAAIEVVGENGTFSCSWSTASEALDRDGATVTSAGECVDENGETFSFDGEARAD